MYSPVYTEKNTSPKKTSTFSISNAAAMRKNIMMAARNMSKTVRIGLQNAKNNRDNARKVAAVRFGGSCRRRNRSRSVRLKRTRKKKRKKRKGKS